MTRHTIIYISGPNDMVDRKTVLDYALAAGMGTLKSDACLCEVVPGEVLAEAVKTAQSGDVFVTNSLASFGVRPSEQRAHILGLMAKNVDIHVVGLGRLDSAIHILKAAWEAAGELERQSDQLRRDWDEREQRLRDEKARFEDRLVARMSAVVGQSSVKEFYRNGGSAPDVEVEVEPEVTDPTALRVRELREQRKWSMEELAAKAGCSKSMVQRIETLGKGADLGRVLSVLEHGA